jgi:hypothetical protein
MKSCEYGFGILQIKEENEIQSIYCFLKTWTNKYFLSYVVVSAAILEKYHFQNSEAFVGNFGRTPK